MTAEYWLLDTSGNDAPDLDEDVSAGATETLDTLRVHNFGTSAASTLRIQIANRGGDATPITAGWIEAQVGGSWEPLVSGSPVALTPPGASAYLDVPLRIVAPSVVGSVVYLRAQIRAEWW